jgi:hypothetical protein
MSPIQKPRLEAEVRQLLAPERQRHLAMLRLPPRESRGSAAGKGHSYAALQHIVG